jgi:hypothetical protein
MAQSLTKLEVARRQLITSTRLFFSDEDSVSVYTLAHAAGEILDALCKRHGKTRFFEQMQSVSGISDRGLRKIARYGRDFFKHADRDPDAILDDFDDTMNDHILIGAALDYGMLTDTKPMEIQVYPLWYFAAYPDKVPAKLHEQGSTAFPGIFKLTREQQKAAGRTLLQNALRHPELMPDPSTDRNLTRSVRTK